MSESSDDVNTLPPTDAWAMLQTDPAVTLIDVRSDMEFLMIGHAKGAVHVPWIDAPDWTVNTSFVANVRKALLGRVKSNGRSSMPLLLICRSGNRSQDAAEALQREGLTDIFIVEGGFEGP